MAIYSRTVSGARYTNVPLQLYRESLHQMLEQRVGEPADIFRRTIFMQRCVHQRNGNPILMRALFFNQCNEIYEPQRIQASGPSNQARVRRLLNLPVVWQLLIYLSKTLIDDVY
jgi:hypothetical protein